jgi:hypothetical protein
MRNLFRTIVMVLAVAFVLPLGGCNGFEQIRIDREKRAMESHEFAKLYPTLDPSKYVDCRLINRVLTHQALNCFRGGGTILGNVTSPYDNSLPAKKVAQSSPSTPNVESPDNLAANVATLRRTNACVRCFLKRANLQNANLYEANLREANLQGANLKGADLRIAKLQGANFQEVNLQGALLAAAYLKGANFEGADLLGAKIEYAHAEGAIGLYPSGADVANNVPNKKAAEPSPKDATVQYRRGRAFFYGKRGYPRDYKEAGKWLKLAAEQGHVDAQDLLFLLNSKTQISPPKPSGAIGLDQSGTTVANAPKLPSTPAKDTTPPFINIAATIAVKTDSPTIRGKATDNERVAQVTVEGRAADLQVDGTFSFSRYVPASGTTVEIIAIDEWGNRAQKTVRLTRSSIQSAAVSFDALNPTGFSSLPNKDAVALIIGVANYKRVADAQYADRDAEFFSDYARRKLGVPQSNIKVLTNDGADFTTIIEAVNIWLPRATKANRSDVYLFFAGHGLGSDDGDELYLLPHGGVPKLLDRTSILRSDLFKSIADAKPRSVTAFLDTCYSGTSRTEETLLASRPVLLTAKRQDIPAGFTLISAAGMDQTAKLLPEAEHGLFSYWLMKGMEGPADGNGDRQITAGELHSYVLAQVSRLQRGQTPELQGDEQKVLVRW